MRATNASRGQRRQILTVAVLCGTLLVAAPRESRGFWIINDLIDAFKGADRASKANEKMLERTAAGDAAGADQAKQQMKQGIQDAAKSAQDLLEKTPGTTVNPTPPDVDDLKKGIWETLKELFNSIIGANRSQLTIPPPVPDGVFAAHGPIYTASLAGQQVNVTPPQSMTVNLWTVAPSDYDGSRGPAPPEFFGLPPAIYAIGTFSDAVLSPFQVFDLAGTNHTYDAAHLAADLLADPALASTAVPGSNFTPAIFSLVPKSNPNGVQVMYLTISSVDTVTGNVSGKFWTGTAVPEPATLSMLVVAMLAMFCLRRVAVG